MNEVRPLTVVQTLSRLALIGVALLAVIAVFAYAGGWLSPARLTQTKMVAAIQAGIGDHPGFRRAHAKGMCIAGWLDSSGAPVPWSKAAVFAQGRVPLIGRVALAGARLTGPKIRKPKICALINPSLSCNCNVQSHREALY